MYVVSEADKVTGKENAVVQELYADKSEAYFQGVRLDVLEAIPLSNRKGSMLEIGAGGCRTLIYAKENGFAEAIYGVDIVDCKLEAGQRESLDGLAIGDIQTMDDAFDGKKFDVIVCPDVLEHLIDPYSVVRKLKGWLKEDGIVVSSLPNINYWRNIIAIIWKDSFTYSDRGILDRSHLRFFARKNVEALFRENGFQVLEVFANAGGWRGRIVQRLTGGLFQRFLAYQYIVVARPLPVVD